jgi:hypothetical protein
VIFLSCKNRNGSVSKVRNKLQNRSVFCFVFCFWNLNNQPYYYIITFTQYTKIRNYYFDWHEGEITHIVYMMRCLQTNTKLKTADKSAGKSARQGNLRHTRARFQSFADEARRVSELLKFYPRVSEISLSCTFCRCLILFLTFISCF